MSRSQETHGDLIFIESLEGYHYLWRKVKF